MAVQLEDSDQFAVSEDESRPAGYDGMVVMSQFSGDAYELTWKDVKTILDSNHVGKPYLIEKYRTDVNSFAIIPMSQELILFFARQRTKA